MITYWCEPWTSGLQFPVTTLWAQAGKGKKTFYVLWPHQVFIITFDPSILTQLCNMLGDNLS